MSKSPLGFLLKNFTSQIEDISALSHYSDESFRAPADYLQNLLQIQQAARTNKPQEPHDLSFGAPIFSDAWNEKILQLIRETPFKNSHLSYPSAGGYWGLRSALLKDFYTHWPANSPNFNPEQVLVTNGANQLISLVFEAFTSPGDGVLLFDPSYMLYSFRARMRSLKIFSLASDVDELGFLTFSKDAFEKASLKSKLVFINSPCNPSGAVLKTEDFLFIREICKKRNILLIRDEVYDEFHKDPKNRFASYPPFPNEIILKSFSKSFGFAGLRLGYALARDEFIKIVRLHQACSVPFVSSISQNIAQELLKEPFYSAAHKEREKTLGYLQKAIEILSTFQNKKNPPKSNGMYLWFPTKKISSLDFCLHIAKNLGIVLMPGDSFGSNSTRYTRISIRNEKSLEALDQILNFSKNIL